MKRLVLTLSFLCLLIASCDSPVSNNSNPLSSASSQSGSLNATLPQISYSKQPVRPDTVRKRLWHQFKSQNGKDWQVRWNKHTGLPASMFAGLSKKAYKGTAKEAALVFLADHAALFGFSSLSNLKYVKTKTYRGVRHVTFHQTVNGIPVYEAEYKVHLRSNGQVDMANGIIYPNIKVSTSASVSKMQAANTAQSDLKLTGKIELNTDAKKVIYRKDDQFHLAWKLVLHSSDPSIDWLYIVDAQSGAILYKLNLLTDVTGDGDVYPTHPGLSSVTDKPFYRLNGNREATGNLCLDCQ